LASSLNAGVRLSAFLEHPLLNRAPFSRLS